MRELRPLPLILSLLAILGSQSGCRDRLTEIAREAADRQARQNEVIAETAQETSAAARRLVAAEARARRDLLLAPGKLQEERDRLLAGWDDLEQSRQAAIERQRQWTATETIGSAVAAAFAALLALGICWRVVAGQGSPAIDVEAACWLLEHDAPAESQAPPLTAHASMNLLETTKPSGDDP